MSAERMAAADSRLTRVHLGFRAFDLHELACHFVAQRAGLYAARGLEVRLFDANFVADEQLPPRTFLAACTGALIDWLRGAALRVVFVACERPMFWLVGRSGASTDLADARIAGYPAGTPPAALLQLLLSGSGVAATVIPARDDPARLGLLRAGEVEAAVVSSAVLAGRLAARGLTVLRFFGDALRLPSTGLAVMRELQARDPALVHAMSECFRDSLRLLREDERLARAALATGLDLKRAECGEALALLHACYTRDGRCESSVTEAGIEAMRRLTGVAERPAIDLYDFSRPDTAYGSLGGSASALNPDSCGSDASRDPSALNRRPVAHDRSR